MKQIVSGIDDIRLMLMKLSKLSVVSISNFCNSFHVFNLYIDKNGYIYDLCLHEGECEHGYELVGEVMITCDTINKLAEGSDEVLKSYLRMCYDALTQRHEGEIKE